MQSDGQRLEERGFTLVEVLVTLIILVFGLLSVAALQVTAIRTSSRADTLNRAAIWATERVETLLSLPCDRVPEVEGCRQLDDVDGDGTGQDRDGDGIDDVGTDKAFGLDDATQATADGIYSSPDGRYLIFWNVAVDTPIPDTKTVRVLVRAQGQGIHQVVPMTFYKAKSR